MGLVGLARRAAKLAVLPLALSARTRPGDLVVLLYHRVGAGGREIDLDPEDFRRHVAYLAASGMVRSLDEALEGETPGGVVVTVDDGYRDFHESVLPVFAEHRVPALLYLATGLVADGGSSGPDALSWHHLEEAVATGLVAVGSHTHSHADLSRATEREAEEEMLRSKGMIEDRLGVACRHFAYPWGVASPPAERAARRIFETAALPWRTNRRGAIDPHRLGRTPVLRSDGLLFFRAKVRGMLDGEATLYRVLRRGPWRRA